MTSMSLADHRQSDVLNAILEIKSSLIERSLELGALLIEAKENDYHLAWGHPTFRSWLEHDSGLDMSERQAYYLMAVVKRSNELGIPQETLRKVKLSKLKVIMSLPAETDPQTIIDLVNEAENASLETVKDVAATLSGSEHVYKTFKLPKEFADDVYRVAVEGCRRQAGSDTRDDGSVSDISESRCLELIYGDFAASAISDEDIVEAEFEDTFVQEEL